jgi:hypothetical protein
MPQFIDAHYLFTAGSDIIELDAWVPDDIISQIDALNKDPSKHEMSREGLETYNGSKSGYQYNFVPEGWGLPDHATTLGSLLYNKGDHLFPHRDKWKTVQPDGSLHAPTSMRLICHINHTNPREFCFLVGDQVVKLEPKRWYAVNTQLVHYGFSFVDGVYHLSCDLHFNEANLEKTTRYLLDVLPFAQPHSDRKGVWCGRN